MFFQWMNDRLKRMTWLDYGIVKVCVFSFALLVTKFYPDIMRFDWRVYAGIFLVSYVYLLVRVFRN